MRYLWKDIQLITGTYDGSLPLAHFLKHYFRQHHRLGSRDRKMLSEMAYAWYRSSKGFEEDLPFEDKMGAALFLCSRQEHSPLFFPEAWQEAYFTDSTDRRAFLQQQGLSFDPEQIFPFDLECSKGISRQDWLYSMLRQPRLFLRLRRHEEDTLQRLRNEHISFERIRPDCLSLPNGAPIDKILPPDRYVVQDYASQQTGRFLAPGKGGQWYDCCSGAGGKSLLLKDLQPGVSLLVSDIRESILHNLTERFKLYGHPAPQRLVLDVADAEAVQQQLNGRRFDGIICDVPCTGSGTWARTPEQLYFFRPSFLEEIVQRQQRILGNVLPLLQAGGKLVYITCSVFRKENEAQLKQIPATFRVKASQLINGMQQEADCLFAGTVEPA